MITENELNMVTKGLQEVFPNAKVKSSNEQGLFRVFCTVNSINTEQFHELQKHLFLCDTEVQLKRSGTGISIHLN